jgi:hypothetical protein
MAQLASLQDVRAVESCSAFVSTRDGWHAPPLGGSISECTITHVDNHTVYAFMRASPGQESVDTGFSSSHHEAFRFSSGLCRFTFRFYCYEERKFRGVFFSVAAFKMVHPCAAVLTQSV